MKVVSVLFLFIAATSAAALNEKILVGNHLDDLITKALVYLRSLLKNTLPWVLPKLIDQHLVDPDVALTLTIKEQYLTQSSFFEIDSIKVDPKALKSIFHFTSPVNHIEGIYNISGFVDFKEVEGMGGFSINATNLVVSGEIDFDVVDHHIVIKDIKWDYSIEDLKADMENLNIEGMDKELSNELMSKQLFNFAIGIRSSTEGLISMYTTSFLNNLLQKYTVQEVIDWLEYIVASTPDYLAPTLASTF